MSLENGEALKTWRFSTMNKWHVNWEIKRVLIQFEEEDVEFACLSADCKVYNFRRNTNQHNPVAESFTRIY